MRRLVLAVLAALLITASVASSAQADGHPSYPKEGIWEGTVESLAHPVPVRFDVTGWGTVVDFHLNGWKLPNSHATLSDPEEWHFRMMDNRRYGYNYDTLGWFETAVFAHGSIDFQTWRANWIRPFEVPRTPPPK